jgi:hypothetical protein
MSGGSMRDRMPQCAAFVDAFREAFGAAEVTEWVRSGIARGTFYAEEAGHTIGKPNDRAFEACSVPVLIDETVKPKGKSWR